MKEEKLKLNKKYKIMLLIFSLLIFIFGITTMVKSLEKERIENKILEYKTSGNINYMINLKENPLYSTNYGMYENVVSKYIDDIELIFRYTFSTDETINTTGVYFANLYLITEYQNNDKVEVLSKEKYELIPRVEQARFNNKSQVYNKKVSIDYEYYNNIAKKWREETGVFTKSYLKVEFIIQNNIKNSKINFEDNHKVYLDIPLLENITVMENADSFNENKILYNENNENINYINISIGFILVVASSLLIYKLLKKCK